MRQGYKLGSQVLRHALVGVVDTVDDESDAAAATGESAAAAGETEPAESDDNASTSGD